MATVLLNAAASAATQGAATWVVQAAATIAGSYIDAWLFGPGAQKQQGPRLDNLRVQASTEGAPIPEIAGKVRIAGQIIWATNLKEVSETEDVGGKGGPSVETTNFTYFANIAVGICEGVIDRVSRVWADGQPLDMSGVTMRVHKGELNQAVDSLIEGVEGTANAPAYRGLAYVVFDNLNITKFGDRIPQFTFEVVRKVSPSDGSGLEDIVQAITLIPSAGERVYDPIIHSRQLYGSATTTENQFGGQATADWNVALDDLESALPNSGTVLLVVGWFGDDIRAGHCNVRPRVEVANKNTSPNSWKVHTVSRGSAVVVSTVDGRPAYGGTPSDDSVVRAIRDLKARGYSVIFYPFIMMDIPAGNTLPNPYTGATGQPVYPWRGRITCDPAIGQPGTVDKTATAATQMTSFFGSVAAADMTVSVNGATNAVTVNYSGPSEWSFRRFILHYAKLCAAINAVDAGAVDAFLIGSEMRGITSVRSNSSTFPAVTNLKTLAADVKGVVGSVKVGYAADWSEYGTYNPGDGSNDLFFHLDPLWSDSNIDFIGVDVYLPLSDWRDGSAHLDAIAGAGSIYDLSYLRDNVEGGEYYDWYYIDASARDLQSRTTIADAVYGKPWVFRTKDFRNWWLNQHYNRPGGVQSGSPTAWTAQSKPIWFTEFGVPSVDKGTNQPNVFYDPKSSESFFPYHSNGTRDDLIQRRGIEAMLSYWAAHNPTSSVYGGPMIGLLSVWTWDARPYPAWPARTDAWGDGALWPLGHWLNGKVGMADLAALIASRCERVGFTNYDVSALAGVVVGYIRDRPMSPRAEIELFMNAYAFDAVESGGVIKFVPRGGAAVATFTPDDCVLPSRGDIITLTRGQEIDLPQAVSVTFIDASNDYQSGSVSASRTAGFSERKLDVTVPLVMDQGQAQIIADRLVAETWIGRDVLKAGIPPSQIALDASDAVNFVIDGQPREFRLSRIMDSWARQVEGQRSEGGIYVPPLPRDAAPVFNAPSVYGAVTLELMDLPMLRDSDIAFAPYAAASATPFAGATLLDSPTGESFTVDTALSVRASIGETVWDFYSGPTERWDLVNTLRVSLYSGALSSLSEDTILSGRANALAIKNSSSTWEIVQFCTATLVSPGVYDLKKLLRGRLGTEHAMRNPVALGARVVVLDSAAKQIQASISERNLPRYYKWGPTPLDVTNPAWQQSTFTAQCNGMKPWAPTNIVGLRNGAGDLTITWKRRTRFGGAWVDGADVPLNEESESYQIDILNGSTVVRTISTATPTASYTAAQQTTDFGSVNYAISAKFYQLSASVGRGWPASVTLY